MARRSFLDVDNSIMEGNQRFTKSGLEENLYQFFSDHGGNFSNNYSNNLADLQNDFNGVLPCASNERFGFNANNTDFQQVSRNSNTETFGNRNHSQMERPSFKSYESFSNNYRNPNFVKDEGVSPLFSYNHQNNNLMENSFRYGPEVFGNGSGDNINGNRNYEVPINYRNDDQLRNATPFPLKREEFRNDNTLPRNDQHFGGNVGSFGPCDDGSTNYRRFSDYQRDNSIPRNPHEFNQNIGTFDSVPGNYEYHSGNTFDESQHQFRTNSLPKNRQEHVGHSNGQSNKYKRFSRGDVSEWKCVRNPEYFPDNEHVSRDVRNEEQYRSSAISRKIRRHSEESILPRGVGRSRPSNYNRGEEHGFEIRNERRQERFRRNSRDDDRHVKKTYDSHRNKYSKVDRRTHEIKTNRKIIYKKDDQFVGPRSASYKKKNNNNHMDGDLPPSSRHSSTKRSSNIIDSKRVSELESHDKQRYKKVNRNTDISSGKTSQPRSDVRIKTEAAVKSKTKENKYLKKKLFLKLRRKRIKAFLKKRKNAIKIKAKVEELEEPRILMPPAEGHIKYEPEKYWKGWWSKYAYIERVIDKVDYEDEEVKKFLTFHYDINKIDLDSKVSTVLSLGLSKIKKTENINEINYDRRIDVYKTLKYMRLMEDKDFQTFLLTREQKSLTETLQSVKDNKIMLALLYQSIISRWHISMQFIKSEKTSLVGQVKHARKLLNDKLFQYFVLDSIHQLKKLTNEDWPGFDAFYNYLK